MTKREQNLLKVYLVMITGCQCGGDKHTTLAALATDSLSYAESTLKEFIDSPYVCGACNQPNQYYIQGCKYEGLYH